jgi:hypothetical protein
VAIEHIEVPDGASTADVAVDKVGTDNYQIVKVGLGADGALDLMLDSGQQTAANSLPVVPASDIVGAAADAPSTDAEDTTARTHTSLLKGIKNYLRTLAAALKAEDATHTSGDAGLPVWAVRTDTPAASSGSSGDYEALHTNKTGSVWVQRQGATPYKNIDCDESEDGVSANPCLLMGFYAYANVAAGTKRYLKLYNATPANVTVGTTAPDMTIELDGTQGIVWSTPLLFSTALTVAATTGLADNDTGAPGANEVIFNCGYTDL